MLLLRKLNHLLLKFTVKFLYIVPITLENENDLILPCVLLAIRICS